METAYTQKDTDFLKEKIKLQTELLKSLFTILVLTASGTIALAVRQAATFNWAELVFAVAGVLVSLFLIRALVKLYRGVNGLIEALRTL